jgi:murein DD-endopeptidase MepM/ murein hydrolase activator NlpD
MNKFKSSIAVGAGIVLLFVIIFSVMVATEDANEIVAQYQNTTQGISRRNASLYAHSVRFIIPGSESIEPCDSISREALGGTAIGGSGELLYGFPLDNWDTLVRSGSPTGRRVHPITRRITNHAGIDFVYQSTGAIKGAEIFAVADGKVVNDPQTYSLNRETGTGAGWWVRIEHTDGLITEYMHMISPALNPDGSQMRRGDSVVRGQVIGLVGNSGGSTGYHLHFGVSRGTNIVIDPSELWGIENMPETREGAVYSPNPWEGGTAREREGL